MLGGKLVTSLQVDEATGEVTGVEASDRASACASGDTTLYPADAVVFAVGISAMQKLVSANACLARQDDFRAIMNLKVSERERPYGHGPVGGAWRAGRRAETCTFISRRHTHLRPRE